MHVPHCRKKRIHGEIITRPATYGSAASLDANYRFGNPHNDHGGGSSRADVKGWDSHLINPARPRVYFLASSDLVSVTFIFVCAAVEAFKARGIIDVAQSGFIL
ncbi:hypothetical protein RRG08_052315 [Elysia crispata]|uniref:Uncharacterized protein n=1 Tax=Elysia crispata TaxID=231223 RepID=A0AAE1AHQ3_9GAST|nr:hypothetical protein RRG08_052315 [Elysia crispata]